MLNRPLYLVLRKRFGQVRITNENTERVEERLPNKGTVTHIAGEHYNVCCPICGDDRYRLSISYRWLSGRPMSTEICTHLIHCYNEECQEVRKPNFWQPLLEDLRAAQMGLLDPGAVHQDVRPKPVNRAAKLPKGLVPIETLSDDHEAIRFLAEKYNIPPKYLGTAYGASWCTEADERCPQAARRVIFPIYVDGQLYSWQGRTIDKGGSPRWYLPPGFVKCFYNCDRIAPHQTPVLAEGITSAIACGPTGTAIFGKALNTVRAQEFGRRWKSVVIATDPETFVPDNRKGGGGRVFAQELAALLKPYVPVIRMLNWPKDILALATRHNNNEDVTVPDAADLGIKVMKGLVDATL